MIWLRRHPERFRGFRSSLPVFIQIQQQIATKLMTGIGKRLAVCRVLVGHMKILASNSGGTIMNRLEIVWRNPQPVRRPHWRSTVKHENGHDVYVLEQLVGSGLLSCWTAICDLEVSNGGRAA